MKENPNPAASSRFQTAAAAAVIFRAGTGLRGLADRVKAPGGSLTVVSLAGAGTTHSAEIPIATCPLPRLRSGNDQPVNSVSPHLSLAGT